ncbi:Kinesin-like protein klp-12 [Caenorhabditis elegans]|uniref:Kinesin-like protein klp-12 n=3 Tax=Caenorhabditis elegans TaxID=6239 RepID=KLP12_CAEEL|nr:Kinesin-like protein klp-12 [Caenorhabditis elegans]G5EGS3.1 RecName: Full=Kinesin-like protein klp-12 [Caenorhabditis elegans]CAB07273.2 Kinesin-like protein klp-12 [Caenorhabditis elegans]|eukprot:NP_001023349.1 Kinesin-like protein [Caenorhabditis elegans]
MADTCVQVALRIRPQGNREKLEGSRVCTSVLPNDPQVTIGGDRSFTYDHVFDMPTLQYVVYESCVEKLVDGLFDGYNATVLAYGQTGSGKTHTMGTAFDAAVTQKEEDLGVIPRAIQHTFRKIAECKAQAIEQGLLEPAFEVSVQFVELYNDDVLDLLSDDRSMSSSIRIHEDSRGEIVLHGVEQRSVFDMHGTMDILKNGALNRTVAATNMNEQSSRSHAIFTLHLKQQRVAANPLDESGEQKTGELEMEMLCAKFHFVDLAGSERMKRTGATGDRAKEGISINVGLLALGNVIAALGGANGKVSHVPYRDSKLTRLLQDSLGGNSRTLMIACCSPSDSDFVETLNTMKYANRAKEIKNKVVANQDKSSKMIGELRSRIAALEAELLEFKQGRRTVDVDGHEVVNDQYHENVYLTSEVNHLRFRVKALNETLDILRTENIDLKAKQEFNSIASLPTAGSGGAEGEVDAIQSTFRKYLEELERTKSLLYESQSTCDQLRKDNARWKALGASRGSGGGNAEFNSQKLIEMAKQEVEKQRKLMESVNIGGENVSSEYSSMAQDEDGTSNEAEELLDEEDLDEDEDETAEEKQEQEESEALQIDLSEVMIELDIKEKLIDQLERAERQNQQIRETYEKKLRELMERIKDTETERDRVLNEGGKRGGNNEQMKAIKQEYELKITDLRKELKKIEALDKEHLKVIAKSQRELQEKTRLKSEVVDLKKAKVELIKKMNEDKKKQKTQQLANARAFATKEKQTRLQANKIRTLEMKDKQREQFLKKTTQEVNALRKEKAVAAATARQANRGTPRGGAAVTNSPARRVRGVVGGVQAIKELAFSAKASKVKWDVIVRKIEESARRRQIVQKMEAELERYLNERHAVMVEIVENEKQFTQSQDVIYRDGLLEAIDSAKQKLQYVQDQITYQQKLICDVDEDITASNAENEPILDVGLKKQTIKQLFDGCDTLSEARYLLQHLFDLCIDKAALAAKVESEFKECAARIEQLEQQSSLKEQLLTSIIEDKNLVDEIEGFVPSDLRKSRTSSQSSLLRSGSPSVVEDAHTLQNYKVRRHTATQEELLFANSEENSMVSDANANPTVDVGADVGDSDERKEKKKRIAFVSTSPASTSFANSTSQSPSFSRNTRFRSTVGGVSNNNNIRKSVQPLINGKGVSSTARKGISRLPSVTEDPEIGIFAKSFPGRSRSNLMSSSSSTTTTTLSSSNLLNPRGTTSSSSSKSVFARISPSWLSDTCAELIMRNNNRKQSRIVPVKDGMRGNVITRTHTLEGHARGVLSVDVNEKLMVTGSKDRTAKLWDIEACREIRTLGIHPNNVHLVKFVPFSNYVFTFSMFEARAWDYRTPECICVKVLNSSGQVNEGDSIDVSQVMPRQNTIPFLETLITAADVDPTGQLLFTSFSAYVRVWNLREWKPLGRLNAASHSPKSEVSCLRTTMTPEGSILAYTGSRDHYVKEYEVGLGTGVIESKCEFTPPHYDNVTAVLPLNGHLYTASKDVNIMKFSLKDGKREHLELRAHQQYIQSLTGFGPKGKELLVSACKDGTIRFWDVGSSSRMKLVEEYSKAHQEGINDMCSTKSMLFTASGDSTVGFWKSNAV